MLDTETKYMVRWVGIMVMLLLGSVMLIGVMGCATVPDQERNDRIIGELEAIFDVYELLRIAQGDKSIAQLIAENPERVAKWMAVVELSIHSIEIFGGDVGVLQSLQNEFKARFGREMNVPVVPNNITFTNK